MNKLLKFAPLSLLPFAFAASAAAIDVQAVVTDIAAQSVSVGAIGAAVLLLIVGIKAFKWVGRAL